MAISFGSFGDIVAAIEVAVKLAEILNSKHGAKRDFADVIADLRLFHRYLGMLLSTWQSRVDCAALDQLFAILRPVIAETKGEIETCLENIITKYGRSLLAPANERRNPKDLAKMVQWHVLEKDRIAQLREKLSRSKEVVLMVQSQANMIAEETNRALVDERTTALMDAEEEARTKLDERLQSLEEKADQLLSMLGQIQIDVGSVNSAMIPFIEIAKSIPSLQEQMFLELRAQASALKSLNPYASNSVLLEDALGWALQIPLDLIESWKVVHAILEERFKDRPGSSLVVRKRYVLREDLSGMEIKQDQPLRYVLRPGQKVNMSMVFYNDPCQLSMCPRCRSTLLRTTETDFTCVNIGCGTKVQRIEEVFSPQVVRDTQQQLDHCATEEDEDMPEDCLDDLYNRDIRSIARLRSEKPDIFKHTRFISRWEDRPSSRGNLCYKTGRNSWWALNKFPESDAIWCSINDAILTLSNGTFTLTPKKSHGNEHVHIDYFFVGPSSEESVPAILIFSMIKRHRIGLWKFLRQLEWVKKHPTLCVVTSGSELFHEGFKRQFALLKM